MKASGVMLPLTDCHSMERIMLDPIRIFVLDIIEALFFLFLKHCFCHARLIGIDKVVKCKIESVDVRTLLYHILIFSC